MMLEIAYWAQNQTSYQSAEEAIKKVYNVSINDDLIRKITNHIGSIIYDNDSKLADETFKTLQAGKIKYSDNKTIENLYIEIDGAAINTRFLNKDDSSWRENKLCVVFNSNNIRYWFDKKTKNYRHEIQKREYTSIIGSVDIFKKHVYSISNKNGLQFAKNIILISDGATWIRNIKEELFPEAQQILDFFHLSQHLYDFAKNYFNQNEKKYKAWVEEKKIMLKDGRHLQVINDIHRLIKKNSDNGAEKLYNYFMNNINNINYKSYLDKNLFIGSGAIESGNKIVLQKRLKGPGMRWDPTNGQTMVTLKSKVESELWYKEVVMPIQKYYNILK